MKKLIFFTLLLLQYGVLSSAFSDIGGHQYEAEILSLAQQGIVQGYPDGSFKPQQSLTRAELLKIILVAKGISLTDQTDCFPDIAGHRAIPYICTAKQKNIIKGYEDGTFKPNQAVSIAEGLKIALWGFDIAISTDTYGKPRYENYLGFVHDNNILSKYSIYPEQVMTRGMMTYVVNNLLAHNTQSRNSSRENFSPWCGKSQPSLPPSSLMVNGSIRQILTTVGNNYHPSRPTALVIAFHGRTNTNDQLAGYLNLPQATQGKAIIVYPLALPEQWPTRTRQNPWDKATTLRDYLLFDQIVKEIWEQYCIDLDQIFVVGHSLGGWFANMLACTRGNVIRGVASVGASPMKFPSCSWPTSALIMHHPQDNLASFAGGEQNRNYVLKQNECWPETIPYDWPEGSNCVQYTHCITPVVWCPYTTNSETPHMRPDFASEMVWKFFSQLE